MCVTLSMFPPLPCSKDQHDTNEQACRTGDNPDSSRLKLGAEDKVAVSDVPAHDVCSGLALKSSRMR